MNEQYSVAPPPPPDGPGYAVEQVQTAEASAFERAGLEEAVQADLSPDQLQELARVTYVETWGRFDGAYSPEQDRQICDLLCQYQAEQRANGQPDYDIFKIKPRAAHLTRKLLSNAAENEVEAVQNDEAIKQNEEADSAEQEADSFAEFKAQLEQDESWLAKPKAEQVADILNHPATPEEVKATWRQYLRVLDIAARNKADSAIITASFDKVDIWNPPSAESFARSFIFDNPGSDLNTGVSAATQAAIAAELGITLPPSEPKTGGDANDVYERGAIETYIDPDTGEQRQRRVPLPKDQRVPFTDEAELGFDSVGNRTAFVQTKVGPYQTELPENATDRDIGEILRTVQLRAKLHELNIAHIFFPDVTLAERGGGEMVVHPWHRDITEQFLGTVVGNRALAGNHLLSQSDLDKIPYVMQFHDRKGDYGIADVNPEQTLEDYRAQGIIDPSGTLIWDRFNALVMANRANLYTEANYAQAAQDEAA